MSPLPLLLALLLALPVHLAAAAPTAGVQQTALPDAPAWLADVDADYRAHYRVAGLEQRRFSAEHWWAIATPLLERQHGFSLETIGHSAQGRPLRHVRWGDGATTVLLWSQMHGDESTASMALADLFAFLGQHPTHPLVVQLRQQLALHVLPILNPDGAARFTRRNAQGIDINRDAAALASPEARALKQLRDRLQPAFGFNLHDQRPGYRAGDSERGTAIALLAPPYSADNAVNPVRARAFGVAARIRVALEPHIKGHIARWDNTYNPRAFGDLMQQWGTSTVLIEAGGIEGDSEKQQLRQLTFLSLLAGLEAIASGSHEDISPALYTDLPENGAVWPDLLLRGATVHSPDRAPVQTDVRIDFTDAMAYRDGRITDIGDLSGSPSRQVIDARGLHLRALPAALPATLEFGSPARLQLSQDAAGTHVTWVLDGDLDVEQVLPQP